MAIVHASNKEQTQALLVKGQRGIALLEALIALLIFSFGILAMAGLQGFMIKGTTEAKNRSDASFIAQRRVAMMWSDPNNLAAYAEEATPVAELPNGSRTTVVNLIPPNAAVEVTVNWQLPGEAAHNFSTNARITGCNLTC